ncbi:glycoside hydrolase family 127 protein [Paenibacillus sp. H1-7]|uniref:glycoside hydrolase family 127 protein n=1 Tax=Paenibacillus sp. H1-7 TaxID=2282849 RepID=UPI001EF798D6|nr:beta-L-arabinofuranosidase domain-containing protein [Paenibacillus sp. H1-7]ULL13524.1 glycoside hydrolase family 127 protein [Paenibacillus sp. H1-7]
MSWSSRQIPLKQVRVEDGFWSPYVRLVREVVIPYQWEALNDRVPGAEPSHAISNLLIAAGRKSGEFGGFVFQDSDIAKWLEAVAYSLSTHPNDELENIADQVIEWIAEAQDDDGYFNTYFIVKEPGKRWTNLTDCHELYCAGHLIEAAVAYYHATGKTRFLEIMSRFADYIGTVFGTKPEQIRGYDGHQEIELALVKLYEVTGKEAYLQLSRYFIDERGGKPSFFIQEWEQRGQTTHWRPGKVPPTNLAYHQAHLPVREQKEAVGHAVRAVYMYTAMADLAAYTGDLTLLEACRTLWSNIVQRQMYITGGIGSTAHGEAFSFDYDLPNDTVYAETCASIGLIFFASRMLRLEAKGHYGDVLERALYNNVAGSMSLDGKHYFYVNPLEVWPKASEGNPGCKHVKPVRQPWFGCSCCPPNIARLLASLGEYIYTSSNDTIFAHLYIGSEAQTTLGAAQVKLKQSSNYPWEGRIQLEVTPEEAAEFTVALRIPGWCQGAGLHINGEPLAIEQIAVDGYAYIRRRWEAGDTVVLELPMSAQLVRSHPRVRANAGKAAIQRGPLVYCLEEADNGGLLPAIRLNAGTRFSERYDSELLGGIVAIETDAEREDESAWNTEALYGTDRKRTESHRLQAVPYCLWGNRGQGEMAVWIREGS